MEVREAWPPAWSELIGEELVDSTFGGDGHSVVLELPSLKR